MATGTLTMIEPKVPISMKFQTENAQNARLAGENHAKHREKSLQRHDCEAKGQPPAD
jgi:hypothetical protein